MKIIEKIVNKSKKMIEGDIPVIAFIGDSVTQGCFEAVVTHNNGIDTVYDANNAYHSYVGKILRILYPNVPVTIINAGISGDNAVHGAERIHKDVLKFNPDLVVVSFGLNDSCGGLEKLDKYIKSLEYIFEEIKKAGCEGIFMTANMMSTHIRYDIKENIIRDAAQSIMQIENDGILKSYFDAAMETAEMHGIYVCDVYSKWRKLAENGVDITVLLANRLNHPIREMHWLFAYSLVEVMMNN